MQDLDVVLIQAPTFWQQPHENREMFEEWFKQVPATTRLVVLPEMFSTGFTMASSQVAETMDGDTVSWLAHSARRLDAVVCGSIVVSEGGRFYNRLVWMTPSGEFSVYDKRHLFRMAEEHQHYSPGSDRIIVEMGGWRICLLVCYDLRFPVWARNQQDYDVLLCVANWPLARQDAWNVLLQARAIENQAFVLGCNVVGTDGNAIEYGGGSAIYAPDGAALAKASNDAELLRYVLDPDLLTQYRNDFPVWRDADDFRLKGDK